MRRAVGAAAAGNEAERRAVDEAIEPLRIARLVERHVMVHGDGAIRQPARRPRYRRARGVKQHEAPGVRRQQLACQPFEGIGCRVGAVQSHGEDQVGLADRLLRPCREVVVGQIEHVVVGTLQRIERARRLGAVERRIGRQDAAGRFGPYQHGSMPGSEYIDEAIDKDLGQLAGAGANDARWCAGADRAGVPC